MKNWLNKIKGKWPTFHESKKIEENSYVSKWKKWGRTGLDILLVAFSSFLLLTLVECLNRQGIQAYLDWMENSFRIWLLNWILYSLMLSLFFFLPRKWFYGWLTFICITVSLIGVVNYVVLQLKGDPLTPLDFLLVGEAANIAEGFQLGKLITIVSVLLVIFVTGSVYFIKKMKKAPSSFLLKTSISIISVVLLFTLADQQQGRTMPFFKVHSKVSNPLRNTLQNGFLVHFALEMSAVKVEKPEKITKEELVNKLATYKKTPIGEEKKPNIIMWMGEAFWDVTKSSKISFSKDPLENFHKWEKEFTSGSVLVKTTGGHTANTEFEVLTGGNTGFLPTGSVPYNQYLTDPMDSLAYTFTNKGYHASAVHPFRNWFYNRNKVYEKLGFNQYISGEFFTNPVMVNNRISDKSFANTILNQMKSTEGQDFIYAVSMQNHSPYATVEPYADLTVTGDILPGQKEVMEKYGRNLYDTDQALLELVKGIEESGEPTVLILFGDHLPRLQSELGLGKKDFQNLFPEDKTDYEKYLRNYQTPLLIWNNIGLEKENIHISASYLGAYLLNELNQEGTAYWDYLYSQYKQNPLLPIVEYYPDAKIKVNELEFYKQLQYDRLFGEGHSYEYPIIPKQNYFLGLVPQTISEVKFIRNEGNKAIYQITGTGFVTNNFIKKPTEVFVDEKSVEATVVSDTVISFKVPTGTKMKTVQTKNIDERNRTYAESVVFNMTSGK